MVGGTPTLLGSLERPNLNHRAGVLYILEHGVMGNAQKPSNSESGNKAGRTDPGHPSLPDGSTGVRRRNFGFLN
jgi:hypothetical protein